MNILHINSNYLTSKLHENLIDQLESKKTKNTIYMPIKDEKKEEFLHQSKHDVIVPVAFKNRDKFLFVYKQKKIYTKLLEHVRPEDFDVIHAHTLFTDGNVAYQLHKKFDIPYVVTVRGYTDIESFFKYRINLRNRGRKILAAAGKIVFLSELNKKTLLSKYIKDEDLRAAIEKKAIVNPNGIDDFWFENAGRPKTMVDTGKLNLIYTGKITKLKNPLTTIKAMDVLKSKYQIDAGLTIVGKVLDEDYAKQLRESGKDKVAFISHSTGAELVDLYQQQDIFIMPSHKETFGLVYPEAMSQGLPIIYTENQGFDNQFADGLVGYPVDSNDPENIADNLMKIVANYEDMSRNAVSHYEVFNWDRISDEFIKAYQDVL